MDQSSDSRKCFRELPRTHQDQYRHIMRELMTFAQEYAIPIGFAPPLVTATVPWAGGLSTSIKLPSTLGSVAGASGCILQLQSGFFLVTADHVLADYEERTNKGERLNWQIGRLPPVDPISRIAWREKASSSRMPYRPTDIVFLRLSEQEAREASGEASILSTPISWPPPALSIDQLVVLVGYPNQLKTLDLKGTMNREACGLFFQVTTIGDGYCKCQFAYKDVFSFSRGLPLPSLDAVNLGGMSGCPAFVLTSSSQYPELQYPCIAGVFTDRWGADKTIEFIEIATFENVQEHEFHESASD